MIDGIQITLRNGKYHWQLSKTFGLTGNATYYHSAPTLQEALAQVMEKVRESERGSEKSVGTCSTVW